jgi:VanZ family protein
VSRGRHDARGPLRPPPPSSAPPRTPPALRRWAALAAVAWVVGLFVLSSWSPGAGTLDFRWRFPHDDKAVHALLYAVLGGLTRIATGRLATTLALAGAVGVADELLQSTVPGRSADPLDWVADVAGAFAGAALVGVLARRRGSGRVAG